MKYIAHRRLRKDALCGPVNIPAMTKVECEGGIIIYNNGIVCYEDCETAHQFFARNDDGYGMERGRLTQAIMKTLAKTNGRGDRQHQERWDRVWSDPVCQPYRRKDDDEYWLWNHEFFNAPVEDLLHIANLVGAKFAYFSSNDKRKAYFDESTTAVDWGLRSPSSSDSAHDVTTNGCCTVESVPGAGGGVYVKQNGVWFQA